MGVDAHQNAYAHASSPTSSGSFWGLNNDTTSHGRKRKPETVPPDDYGYEQVQPKKKASKSEAKASVSEEKRLRRYRPKPPAAFDAILERATTQRFFVLSRTLCGTEDCPEMFLQVTGSTGNIYNVCIARQPTCDCPHAKAGNQCKHVVFVLKKVLRAKYQYVYQLALLSSELKDIMAHAPNPEADAQGRFGPGRNEDKNRKPVEGDCPICFEEMMMGPGKEQLVWCKAACGQNIHRQCFEMWAATKRQAGGGGAAKVSCPYCRSPWEGDSDIMKTIDMRRAKLTGEGYHNVADQLGVSTRRDYSTYSTWWSGHPGYRGRRSYW